MVTDEEEYLRTLVQYLIDSGSPELAAVMIDGGTEILRDHEGTEYGLALDVPTSGYDFITSDPAMRRALEKAVETITSGHMFNFYDNKQIAPEVRVRVMRMKVEEGWQNIAREMIVNLKGNNQALVSKKVFQRKGKALLTYNEVGYASNSEIRIAQDLEERQVLFFPLALGVRADTGEFYRDHREVDFLVCDDGTWGVLEVSYHPDRYEKDAEKDAWFKKSGILCVQHYTAERCYNEPSRVVEEFLSILRKHRR